ncbi:MAG: curli assembly protein CsgF [Calditrichae bacterium]|nr:curli assembly protein CsgF [Calditrichota bacterium]MCB9058511.1 curli assembly protein CsgF [Calditrichia bacterium]
MYRFTVFFLFLLASLSYATELVYTPVNPSFGGNPYNASWLQSQAEAQNKFTAKRTTSSYQSADALDNFTESLNRSILSRLSRQIVTDAFGENTLEAGKYEIGDFEIEVTEGAEGVTIQIIDAATGGETTVVVPYF